MSKWMCVYLCLFTLALTLKLCVALASCVMNVYYASMHGSAAGLCRVFVGDLLSIGMLCEMFLCIFMSRRKVGQYKDR